MTGYLPLAAFDAIVFTDRFRSAGGLRVPVNVAFACRVRTAKVFEPPDIQLSKNGLEGIIFRIAFKSHDINDSGKDPSIVRRLEGGFL
jgi:hypothetical protein